MKYLYILIFCLAVFVRFYNFSHVPPSPYWDEVSLGYDAYSILKTGKDHHGNVFPIVAFESYGDWKPSGYYYALLPSIALFGLNDFALRLPAALAGLAIVIGVGFLAKQIKINPLIAVFVASISPWAIQFSRAGWEVNLATACIVWAVVCGFRAIHNKKLTLLYELLSIFLFIFSMYTYHVARVVAPLICIALFLWQVYELTADTKKISFAGVVAVLKNNFIMYGMMILFGLVLLSPLLKNLGNPQTTQRFQETSIFNNLDVITESNDRKAAEGNSLVSRVLYHRDVLFSREVLKNYFSHFTLEFLFLSGDKNPRHSVQYVGQLYHIELIFLLVGLYAWLRRLNRTKLFFFFWLLVAIIPAAITYASPHALRILPAMPIFLLVIATGISEVIFYLQRTILQWSKRYSFSFSPMMLTRVIVLGISVLYLLEFVPFWIFYQKIYPIKYSQEWQYGYKDVMKNVADLRLQFPDDQIYVTREQGRPAMYYWYYNQIDPRLVQAQEESAKKDQGEFLTYDKIAFITESKEITASKALVAGSPEFFAQLAADHTIEISNTIPALDGTIVWQVGWVLKK